MQKAVELADRRPAAAAEPNDSVSSPPPFSQAVIDVERASIQAICPAISRRALARGSTAGTGR